MSALNLPPDYRELYEAKEAECRMLLDKLDASNETLRDRFAMTCPGGYVEFLKVADCYTHDLDGYAQFRFDYAGAMMKARGK